MADSGFSRGGGQPQNLEQKPITWQDVCRKLNENERNWGGGRALDPGSANGRAEPSFENSKKYSLKHMKIYNVRLKESGVRVLTVVVVTGSHLCLGTSRQTRSL